jgi:hypothetical protein
MEEHALEVEKVRFYVADEADRRRSAPWYVRENAGSVYVGPSLLGGSLKLSFHKTGGSADGRDSQYGTTSRYVERLRAAGFWNFPRLARWSRPVPPLHGATQVASILFPTDFLRTPLPPPPPGKTKFALPIAPPGSALEVGLFYSRSVPQELEALFIGKGLTPLFFVPANAGQFVSVTARHVAFDPNSIPKFPLTAVPLGDGPHPGQTIDTASAIMLRDMPKDGGVVHLAEVTGLKVTRSEELMSTDEGGLDGIG